MNVDLKRKTDMYRRAAEYYGWKECSYLMVDRSKKTHWMDERVKLLRVMHKLIVLSQFARLADLLPNASDITISLVTNHPTQGCAVFHCLTPEQVLESIANGNRGTDISSRTLVRDDRQYICGSDPIPLIHSGVEWSRAPVHSDALGTG